MSGKSKNQTVMERAAMRETRGAQESTHVCASPTCPHPAEHIAMRDLYPVVTFTPHRRTVFFHRTCAPTVAATR